MPRITRKAQTMSERLGFQDPDLSTPEHDAMVFWTKAYLKDYFAFKSYEGFDLEEFEKKLDIAEAHWPQDKDLRSKLKETASSFFMETDDFCQIRLEHPIVNRSGFILGYADIMAQSLRITFNVSPTNYCGEKLKPNIDKWTPSPIYVEVKPKIYSFGELIRQIRTYQTVTSGNQWYVASPDTRFEEAIRDEGIEFIQITDGYKDYL
jgi:hypothetical protein